MKQVRCTIDVNGIKHELHVLSHFTLLDLLRDKLDLTGTNEGCRMGECGSCTVLLDGRPIPACLVLAPTANGRKVITIEGVAGESDPHPVQELFIRHGALQCGFCTAGMIVSALAIVEESRQATGKPFGEQEIRERLVGNLCRCTGFAKIVSAVEEACRG